ncbi:chaperone protein HtpG [Oceaniovalibus guishaninsula JLT2003]|uniref:Chaperone protein HtpG n=1 Tax=Oceaniovalibus guishaninsula JLT2003 TaxID=1231392 RepID=K2HDK4_9RHOB|nr:cytochrome c3 family protein [Oceaniovalibus guishaninsula]EKE44612.1 chaperone protein HtpG [Oceaniovalibus guishaninsula JLT2003]
MAQPFGSGANTVTRLVLLALIVVPLSAAALGMTLARSDYVTGQDRTVEQPIPFSHAHHTAEIGIDCRYCHTSVEVSAKAGIPPTTTCMTCHSQLWTNSEMLAPVRESLVTGVRLKWRPVNDLPDYVYFNHSVHVTNGVGCTTCHGPVGEMKLMRQDAPLTMEWCLSCHRDVGPNLRRPEDIYLPFPPRPQASRAETQRLLDYYDIHDGNLAECSTCHR